MLSDSDSSGRLELVAERLAEHRPKLRWLRRFSPRSAVAIILRPGESGFEALMIKRAEREGDPWSGHMAFPGGRMDPGDRHGLAVAQRETWEEIGLPKEGYSDCVGRLSDLSARGHFSWRLPMVISSFVFTIDSEPALKLNYEVDDTLWVPLDYLADASNRETMEWRFKGINFTLPCYFYGGQRIWGLSLMMLDELLSVLNPSSNADR